jgi:hypothetical protein
MIPIDTRHLLLAGLVTLALLGLVAMMRSTRSQAHQTAHIVPGSAGVLGIASRTIVTAGVIVAVQWLVITNADHHDLVFWLVLAVPALLAAVTVIRALTVTVLASRGGGRW